MNLEYESALKPRPWYHSRCQISFFFSSEANVRLPHRLSSPPFSAAPNLWSHCTQQLDHIYTAQTTLFCTGRHNTFVYLEVLDSKWQKSQSSYLNISREGLGNVEGGLLTHESGTPGWNWLQQLQVLKCCCHIFLFFPIVPPFQLCFSVFIIFPVWGKFQEGRNGSRYLQIHLVLPRFPRKKTVSFAQWAFIKSQGTIWIASL